MVKVTETALSRLKRKLKRQPEGVAVRITVEDGHVQFRPDTEQKGDVVFARSGQSLLLVGLETAKRITNRTLDVVKTLDGDRLRFVRPALRGIDSLGRKQRQYPDLMRTAGL